MAGTDPNFSAAEFRDAIRFAMKMGSPGAEEDKATFRWNPSRTFSTADPAGQPYDWTSVPASDSTPPDVVTDLVAVEFTGRPQASGITSMGTFDPSGVTLTILDEDYEDVKTANEVLLGGNTYVIRFHAPPTGLFDATVHTIYAEAVDES